MKTKWEASEESPEQVDKSKCAAYGCPCGAVGTKGGDSWFCQYHLHAPAAFWVEITTRLKQRIQIVNLAAQLRRLHAFGEPFDLKGWLVYLEGYAPELMPIPADNDRQGEFSTKLWGGRIEDTLRNKVRANLVAELAPDTHKLTGFKGVLQEFMKVSERAKA